jgi:D-threo-aldose 1-dehydrogenase
MHVGSSLNAGFISATRATTMARRPGIFPASTWRSALQFSAAPDVAAALIVGAHTEAQVLANVSSMQGTIPPEFWAELKRQNLIEQNAPTPTAA